MDPPAGGGMRNLKFKIRAVIRFSLIFVEFKANLFKGDKQYK